MAHCHIGHNGLKTMCWAQWGYGNLAIVVWAGVVVQALRGVDGHECSSDVDVLGLGISRRQLIGCLDHVLEGQPVNAAPCPPANNEPQNHCSKANDCSKALPKAPFHLLLHTASVWNSVSTYTTALLEHGSAASQR